MQWIIVGSVGGGVTTKHIDTPQGMTYEAACKLADEINTMYAAQQPLAVDKACTCIKPGYFPRRINDECLECGGSISLATKANR